MVFQRVGKRNSLAFGKDTRKYPVLEGKRCDYLNRKFKSKRGPRSVFQKMFAHTFLRGR